VLERIFHARGDGENHQDGEQMTAQQPGNLWQAHDRCPIPSSHMTVAPARLFPKVHFAQYRPQMSYGCYLADESHEGLESGHGMVMNSPNGLHFGASNR
jgi:hypothetical protein